MTSPAPTTTTTDRLDIVTSVQINTDQHGNMITVAQAKLHPLLQDLGKLGTALFF